MPLLNWRRWLQSARHSKTRKPHRRAAQRLTLEPLESRLAPATFVWDGGGANNRWTTPENWVGDAAPTATGFADLLFASGAGHLSNFNDFESANFNSISFSGSGYTLTGNELTVGSATAGTGFIIANLGALNNVIDFNIHLGGTGGQRQFFTVNTVSATLTVNGQLLTSTGVELSKDGPGILVLTANNSGFNGPISVVEGALNIRHANALGTSGAPTTVLSSQFKTGQVQVENVSGPISEPLILNGPGPINDGALVNIAGANVWRGSITLDSDATVGARAGTLTIQSVISDLGAGHDLTKEGAAKVILDPLGSASGNTYRGRTFVNDGILTIRHSRALGNEPVPIPGVNDTVVQSAPNRSGTLQLEFVANSERIDPNATATGFTVPAELLTLNGPGVEGIHVLPKEHLVVGDGTVSGALNNLAGQNTWQQDITLWSNDTSIVFNDRLWDWATVGIGAEAGAELIIAGHVKDDLISGSATLANTDYALIKVRPGRVIFITSNSYRGRTEILHGYLNIRDSQALGANGSTRNETIVFPQGTLELEADSIPDSNPAGPAPDGTPHLNTDIVITGAGERLQLMGDGAGGDGALRNIRGTNEITGTIPLIVSIGRGTSRTPPAPPRPVVLRDPRIPLWFTVTFAGPRDGQALAGASVGVEPDRAPYTQFDLSQLTLSGEISGANFTKVGKGELVLAETANTYVGSTFLLEGWITARNSRSLGADIIGPDTVQPATFIAQGAALHLKRTRLGGDIDIQERIFVSGIGISHRDGLPANVFPELHQRGALLNLSGNNLFGGIINLVATTSVSQIGIGTDIANSPWVPNDQTVTQSSLTIYNMIQEQASNQANVLKGIPESPSPVPTGINKLGRKRLLLQGPGTFSGDNRVSEGVLRVQNDIALGMISGTTTVAAGAALELQGYANTPGLPEVQKLSQWASSVIDFSSEWLPTPGWKAVDATGPPNTFRYGDIPTSWSANNQNGPPNPEFITLAYATPVFAHGVTVRETFQNGFVFRIDVVGIDDIFRTVWTGTDPSQPGEPVDFSVNFPTTAFLVKGVRVYVNPLHGGSWEEIDAVQLRGDKPPPTYNNTLNGGLFGGIQIRENLVLNGPGNRTTNDPTHNFSSPVLVHPFTSVADDNAWRAPITLAGDVTIDTTGDSRLSLWKTIDGNAGITKVGTGKLVLGGNNTYTGLTTITQGTVNLQSSSALGTPAAGTFVSANAQIELQGDITIGGESLTVQGDGPNTAAIPLRWFGQGPGPIRNGQTVGREHVTGRTSGLAVDPFDSNVMYLSAAGGGAWRSRNGGFTWEQLIDQVPGLTFNQILFTGAIAVAPTDSNYLYVGLGESVNSGDAYYGRGVLKSNDRGKTWTLIQPPNSAFDRHTVSKIVVDPVNPEIVYVALQGNGVNDLPPANYGIWRFNGSRWINLTQQLSPARAGQTPPTPGPDDNTAITFSPAAHHYSDLVVINANPLLSSPRYPSPAPGFPDQPQRRIVSFAIGNALGTGINAVYTSVNANTNVDNPAWNINGFPTGTENFGGCTFAWIGVPRNGRIRLGATRGIRLVQSNAGSPNNPNQATFYATIAHGDNAARQDQPNADGGCGTDSTFRDFHTATATYDPATLAWTMGGWGALGSQPGPANSRFGYLGRQGSYDSVVTVQPGNPNFVFVGGVGRPFTMGPFVYDGTAWSEVGDPTSGKAPHVDYHSAAWDRPGRTPFEGPARLLVGNDGGVWRLENTAPPNNATARWTNLNGNFLQITTFNGLDVHPSNPFFAVGGSQDNGTEIYNDSPGWEHVEDGDGGVVRINYNNPNIMYHIQNGLLRRSLEGGGRGTWSTIYSVPTLYVPLILDRTNPSRLLLPDFDPATFGFTDLRETMNAEAPTPTFNLIGSVSNGFGSIIQIAVSDRQGQWQNDTVFPLVVDRGSDSYDSDTIYVLSSEGVHLTKNHGQIWVLRNSGLNLNGIADLIVDPRNRDIAYVVRSVFGGGHIFKTDNAGRSWTDISGNLPDLPTWKVVVNPRTGDIYVGNDNGVYVLPGGGGASWTRVGVGLPNAQVIELVYNPLTNMLSAATYGRGLYQIWLDDLRNNGGGIRAVSGASVWTGNITLTGATEFRAENGAQLTIVGQVRDDSAGANHRITKLGLGRFVFAGDNTYGGVTDIKEGAIIARHPHALGQATATGNTVVQVGAALEMQADIEREPVELNGNGILRDGHFTGALRNVSNNNTFTGTLTLNTQATGPSNNPPLPSDARQQITIGVDSGSQLTIGSKTGLAGVGTITEIGGPRNLTKELSGLLVLNSANSHSGFTQVNQGALRVEHARALGTSAGRTEVRNAAQLQLNKDVSGNPITIVGEELFLSGRGIFDSGALLNVAGDNTWQGPISLRSIPSLPAPPPAAPPNFVSMGVSNAGDTVTINGAIGEFGGSFGLTKVGPGKLVLKQADTYSGVTNITNGIVNIQHGQALGTAGGPATNGTVVAAGTALEIQSATGITITGETATINGDGLANTGAIRNVQGNNSWTGAVLLPTTSSIGTDAASSLSISGGVSSAAAIDLKKVGAGTLFLPTANPALAGQLLINTGVVNIGNANALGGPGSARTIVDAGTTLQLQGGIVVADEDLTLNGNGFGSKGALENLSGNNTWARTIVLGSHSAIGVSAAVDTLVINQPITEAGTALNVTKVGPGTLDFRAANAYTGTTTVADGTLLLDNATGTAIAANLTVGDGSGAAGSAVARWLFNAEVPSAATITVNGDGKADLNNLLQTSAVLRLVDGQATTGAGATGRWTVNALDMSGGVFTIGVAGSQLVLAGSVTATSTSTAAAGTALIQAGAGGIVSLSGAPRTFTVANGANVSDLRITAPIVGTGIEGLTKAGPGLMEIDSAANAYTGLTTINGGVLKVDGAIGNVLLNGGAVGGTGVVGTMSSNATAGNGVFPGDVPGPGILTAGNTVLNDKTTFFVDLNTTSVGSGYDRLVVNGSINLGGATLNGAVDPIIQIGESFTIVTATGGITGRFGSGATAFLGGKKFTITYNANDVVITRVKNNVTVTLSSSANPSVFGQAVTFTVTVTPEPGAIITPTGVVTFTVDSNNQPPVGGNKILDASGRAAHTPPTLSVGTHTASVVYLGDADFNGGSATLTPIQQVDQANTTVSLSSPVNPSVWGQDVTITATVNPIAPASGTPTGFIRFIVNGVAGAPTAMSGGQATLRLTGLTIGQHTIRASYGGDSNFIGSGSDNFTQQVQKANVNVVAGSSPNPTTFGQQATFTVTVSAAAPGAGQPTGVVDFKEGTTTIATVSLTNGSGSFQISSLPAGRHDLTAEYSGDGSFNAGSRTLSHTVNKANTTTTVSSSLNPSTFGREVTFTATVVTNAPGVGTPVGNATFVIDGASQTPDVPLDATGKASFSISTLTGGTHTIRVLYVGNANFNGSNSTLLNQTVNKANTATTISSSVNPSVAGQPVTFTARVATLPPGVGTATGTVTFFINTVAQTPAATLDTSGTATYTTNSLLFGTHKVAAVYNGNVNFQGSEATLGPDDQRVNSSNTTTTVSTPTNPSVFGQPVTFTATVAANFPSTGTPTGNVRFFIDGTAQPPDVALAAGEATIMLRNLAVGSHVVRADFQGTDSYLASSGSLSQTVDKANTTTTLATSNPSAVFGEARIVATVVAQSPSTARPTGDVVFTITSGATITTQTVTLDATGRARLLPHLGVGSYTIRAAYQGTADLNGSASDPINQTITRANTTTRLTTSKHPAVYGEPVIRATVTADLPSSAVPEGTVTFFVNNGSTTSQITITLNAGGVAVLTPNLDVGNYTITAFYNGTTNLIGSSSDPLNQAINPAGTTTTVSSSANPSVFGQEVTFTVTVAAAAPSTATPIGNVTFVIDGVSQPAQALDSAGKATFTSGTLNVGTHAVTVSYAGTTNFNPGSGALSGGQNVTKASTSVTVSASPSPSTFGQSVTFTATVAAVPPGGGTPTGNATFTIDGVNQTPSIALDAAGKATFTTSTLAAGSRVITVTYNGSGNHNTRTSPSFTHAVSKADTSTTVSASGNPTVFGQSVTFTATVAAVAPGAGTPTGNVSFFVDGTAQSPDAVLDGTGKATFSSSTLAAGTRTITVSYLGAGNFNTSSSGGFIQTVNQASTAAAVTSSVNPSKVGQSVTFTVTVSANAPSTATPAGNVRFTIDGVNQTPDVALNSAGKATLSSSSLGAGTHTIVVSYLGNSNFDASTSPSFTQTVDKSSTSTTLTSSNQNAVYGAAVITATVSATAPGGGIPSGTVTFTITGTSNRAVTINLDATGKATLSPPLDVGVYTITAAYNGSSNYNTSSAGPLAQTVTKANTTTTLATTNPNAVYGEAVITATVTANSPSTATPTGTVTFNITGTSSSSVTVTLDATGKARLSSALDAGTYTITATYNGTGNFNVSAGGPMSQTVNKANTTTVVSSSNNPSVVGQSVTFAATVAAAAPGSGTPQGTVVFQVDGVNQAAVAVNTSGQATFTTSSLSLGNHTGTATYQGSGNFNGSTSASFTQSVSQFPSFATFQAGDDQVFGLDNSGTLWRYRPSDNSYLSAGFGGLEIVVSNHGDGNPNNDIVFLRGTDSKIWFWTGIFWSDTGGYLPDINAGDNQVFGVGFDGQIWQFHVTNGWRASGGYGAEIAIGSVGDGVSSNDVVFLKSHDTRIWVWTQTSWSFTGGYLRTIVGGDNQVFGVGHDDQVWRFRVSGQGAGWLPSGGFGSEIVVGNTGDSNPHNDIVWLRVADNSMWMWDQSNWANLNQKLKTIAAGDYQLFGLDEGGQLLRFLTGPSGGWRSSGFVGDRLTVGSDMNDFAADDVAFLLDAANTLKVWRP